MLRRTFFLLLCFAALLGVASAGPALAQDTTDGTLPATDANRSAETAIVSGRAADVAPSEATTPNAQGITVKFNVTAPGRRCEVTLTPWPPDAIKAVERAAEIWSALLNSSQPILIDACWTEFKQLNSKGELVPNLNTLANCGSYDGVYQNFAGAPFPDTQYPLALANHLSNSDLNGSEPEMQCRFNASFATNGNLWYMKTDGMVPPNQWDLLTVALHEMGHGFGFEGSVNWDDGADSTECDGTMGNGCYGSPPNVFDRYVQTANGTSILSYSSPSKPLGDALIGDTLVFSGTNATAANVGVKPRLQSSAPWKFGSSYQHLRDGTFSNVATGLMKPTTPAGTAIHHPGVVALGILKDMGWTIYDLSKTYVDASNAGLENGGVLHPFNTALEGVSAVPYGGRVLFFAGDYHENLTISRPMTLESIQGVVKIGQ